MSCTHFTCEKGHVNSEAKLDGYPFGDRLLEGVMFIVFEDEDGWHAEMETSSYAIAGS